MENKNAEKNKEEAEILDLLMQAEGKDFTINISSSEDNDGFRVNATGNWLAQLIALKRVEKDLLKDITKETKIEPKALSKVLDMYISVGKIAEILNKICGDFIE